MTKRSWFKLATYIVLFGTAAMITSAAEFLAIVCITWAHNIEYHMKD